MFELRAHSASRLRGERLTSVVNHLSIPVRRSGPSRVDNTFNTWLTTEKGGTQ